MVIASVSYADGVCDYRITKTTEGLYQVTHWVTPQYDHKGEANISRESYPQPFTLYGQEIHNITELTFYNLSEAMTFIGKLLED